ncbi:MAG TPA: hypothetical protein VMW79_10745 [Anaerolineae bacterium]|nr:hypothetical protein [Anaerolineae bacterium]
MAWPKHVGQVIQLLEDGIYVIIELRGYLEAKAGDGDTRAAQYAGRLEGVQNLFKLIRQQQYEQIGLFGPEEHSKAKE